MALYNKVRPKRFSDVLGQDIAVKMLRKGLLEKGEEYPQCSIFLGPHGTGKTTCARILAKVLNCENPGGDGEPCNCCPSCKEIDAGTSPSVYELDAASNNGVADAREIIKEAGYVPVGRKKVFILDEVQMLTKEAWNCLLKALEEPPKDVYFILCTTEALKILKTAESRCQKVIFHLVETKIIEDRIYELCRDEGIEISPGAVELIARQAGGHLRDALSLLEKYSSFDYIDEELIREDMGLPEEDALFLALMGVFTGDVSSLNKALSGVRSAKRFAAALIEMLSQIFEQRAGALANVPAGYAERLSAVSKGVPDARVSQVQKKLLDAYPVLGQSVADFYLSATLSNAVREESLLSRLEREVAQIREGGVKIQQAEVVPFPKPTLVKTTAPEPSIFDDMTDAELDDLAAEFEGEAKPVEGPVAKEGPVKADPAPEPEPVVEEHADEPAPEPGEEIPEEPVKAVEEPEEAPAAEAEFAEGFCEEDEDPGYVSADEIAALFDDEPAPAEKPGMTAAEVKALLDECKAEEEEKARKKAESAPVSKEPEPASKPASDGPKEKAVSYDDLLADLDDDEDEDVEEVAPEEPVEESPKGEEKKDEPSLDDGWDELFADPQTSFF